MSNSEGANEILSLPSYPYNNLQDIFNDTSLWFTSEPTFYRPVEYNENEGPNPNIIERIQDLSSIFSRLLKDSSQFQRIDLATSDVFIEKHSTFIPFLTNDPNLFGCLIRTEESVDQERDELQYFELVLKYRVPIKGTDNAFLLCLSIGLIQDEEGRLLYGESSKAQENVGIIEKVYRTFKYQIIDLFIEEETGTSVTPLEFSNSKEVRTPSLDDKTLLLSSKKPNEIVSPNDLVTLVNSILSNKRGLEEKRLLITASILDNIIQVMEGLKPVRLLKRHIPTRSIMGSYDNVFDNLKKRGFL